MTKASDLRSRSDEELQGLLYDLRKEIFDKENVLARKEKDVQPYEVIQKRREIARILTVLRERQS